MTANQQGVSEGQGQVVCAKCQHPMRPGELACSTCGHPLQSTGKTEKLPTATPERSVEVHRQTALLGETSVILEIGNESLKLPIGNALVLGRHSEGPATTQPDIDLSRFASRELGISRRHIEIRRIGPVFMVIDLRSSNGTWINGSRVVAGTRRLLRDGDDLQLAELKIKVHFEEVN